jgi:hypothetical protein
MKANVIRAVDADAYEYLSAFAPYYIAEIERDLAEGMTPDAIKRAVAAEVGPERVNLSNRCEQAARHVVRSKKDA